MQDGAAPKRYDPERLTALAAAVFAGLDMSEADARLVGECLVLADLRGVGSHGLARLEIYAERIRRGLVKPRPKMVLTQAAPAAAALEGDQGLGYVVTTRATDEAMRLAETTGIGLVAVRNSTHFGMAATYLLQAAAKGYAAFVFTNASSAMPIWGGRKAFLGTSPFAFGAPGNGAAPDMVLDMATSVVARGKVRRAAAKGEPIPEGWALDKEGRPTTDAKAGYEGIVLPMAGPKGSGLSLMMEVIAGVMSGSSFGGDVGNAYFNFSRPQNVGHSVIAFRPDLFTGPDYTDRYATLVTRAKAQETAEGFDEIMIPGEPEARREAAARRDGLAVSDEDIAMLRREAERGGIDADFHLEPLR